INFTATGLTGVTSGNVVVSAGPAAKLTIQTQPSATATVTAPFAQQPVIRVEDAFGNLRSTDNITVVTAARNAGTGSLLGTVSVTAASGLATFTNLAHNTVETITIDFNATGLTGATSSNVVVSKGNTTTTVTSSANPSVFSQSVTFTATVTATPPGTGTPTGTVAFKDGATTLATVALDGAGQATFTTSSLSAAAHSMTAVYNGDGNFITSTSSVVTQTVNPGPFAKLQILVPGETAAPGTASGKTGPP